MKNTTPIGKILLCQRPGGAFAYITDGWQRALLDAGFAVDRWDGQESTWEAFNPDLYIGCSGHRQKIPPNRKAKVAIHVNPFGTTVPGIDEQPQVIAWVKKQQPDAVFGYGLAPHKHYWSKWPSAIQGPWVPMATAADVCHYSKCGNNDKVDVVYLGGRWPYKAKVIDAYLLPLLKSGTVSYALRGWGGWPDSIQHQGLKDGRESEFYSIGRVAPCISEPHTHQYGIDVPERVFKAIVCGCIAIHDPISNPTDYFTSVPIAKNPEHYFKLVRQHAVMPIDERKELAAMQYREIVTKHTYHHRLAGLCAAMGLDAFATALSKRAGEVAAN